MPDPLDIDTLARGRRRRAPAAGADAPIEEQLGALVAFAAEHPDLRAFLGDQAVRPEGKAEALDRLLRERTHPLLRHTVLALLELDGLGRLPRLASAYFAARAERNGYRDGELTAPAEPTPEQLAAIRAEAGRLLGYPVSLRVRVDPSLLGGLRLRVGDFVIDDTVDSRLETFRRRLTEA